MTKTYTVLRDCWITQQHLRKGATLSLTAAQARYPLKEGKIMLTQTEKASTKKPSKK